MAENHGLEGSQPVDLSKHPSWNVPTPQNIVSTVNLDVKLDLKFIARSLPNVEYNPERIAAVIMKIREPKTTALIFASGKMVCTGAKSEQESWLATRKFARVMQKLGYPARFKDFKTQNIVGSCDMKFLEGLAYSIGAFSSNHPAGKPAPVLKRAPSKTYLSDVISVIPLAQRAPPESVLSEVISIMSNLFCDSRGNLTTDEQLRIAYEAADILKNHEQS